MTHELSPFLAAFDWSGIVEALIAAVASVVNTFGIVILYRHIRTPSGTRIGTQVEDLQHVALANHYRITKLASSLGEDLGEDPEQIRRIPRD